MKPIFLVLNILFSFITSANGCQQPCLFVSNTTNILSVSASLDHDPVLVLSNLSRAVALDVHVSRKMIFWSDVGDKSIKRANTDGSNMQVIVKDWIGVCDGLAVEWSTDLLYWTDTTFNIIEVAHLDGSRRRVLISDNLDEPRGIAVDPMSGLMFWTDWGSNPKIESAYLNGENRQVIITSSLGWTNDIALDHTPKKIYWIDAKTDNIESADYSGTNRKQLFHFSGIHPFGVALLSQWLYWTDWATASGLHRLYKTGAFSKNGKISGRTMGLTAFDSSVQPSTSNHCQQNNGGCSFLCLLKPNGYVCTCPFGMVLGNDNKTCSIPANGCQQPCLYVSNTTHILSVPASLDHHPVAVLSNLSRAIAIDVHVRHKLIFWSDASDKSIKRANTDGSNITVIVEDWIGVCDGLAVEWSTDLLYWTDTTFNKIEVAHLDGSRRRVLISDNLDQPRGIAVDPLSGYMFWTDWGSNPKIESAYLNGDNRQAIITSSLGWPNDIALDHTPKKIYWADAKTDKIESADYSGTNRKQLFYNAIIHPFGVALLSQWLYWTDWNTVSGLHQMNKTTGNLTNKFHIFSPRSRMGLAMFDSSNQPSASNDCQQNNGGCSFICLLKPNGYTCVCPNGTTLGNDGKTCNAAGIDCPALTTPANAIKSNCHGQTHETPGTVCQFSCVHGYQPVIAQLRRCQSNGTWSESTLVCHPVTCHPLASPKFGSLSPSACFTRGKYNDVCHVACSSGFRIRGTLTRTCGSDGKWTGQNDTVCEDVTPPTFSNTCPSDKVYHLGACSSNITVNWTPPVASDNSGNVKVRIPSLQPPVTLTAGIYTINYTAEDQSGNTRSCLFKIQVVKKFCRHLSPSVNGLITSFSCSNVFGSVAVLGCKSGYFITGSSTRTCLSSGQWSNAPPTCTRVTCPSLKHLKFGTIEPSQCTTGLPVVSGTWCLFKCDLIGGFENVGPQQANCTVNGTWSVDVKQISCKDIRRPQLQCPKDESMNTDAGKAVATYSWTVPVPHDNSGESLTVSVNPDGVSPPHQFSLGETLIRYTTKDSAGLQSSCSFLVTVQDVEPPRKVKCPADMNINSKKEYKKVYLPRAVFKDNVKVTSIITDRKNGTNMRWGEYKVTYTAFDQSGNTAKCVIKISITSNACQRPTPPRNGALACDAIAAGMQCTVHCNPGYQFVATQSRLYICTPKGEWRSIGAHRSPVTQPDIPDCSVASNPDVKVEGILHYLTENCKEQNPTEVRKKFMDILKEMFIKLGIMEWYCQQAKGCRLDNVRVTCGDAAKRRRRSTDNAEKLSIHFQMKIPLPKNSSSDSINATLAAIKSSVLETINKSASHFEVNGVKLTLQSSTLKVVGLECTEGQVLKGAVCAGCPPGYYLALSSKSCSPCPVNHYQENEEKTSCAACPSGTSTRDNTGSKSCLKDGKAVSHSNVVVPVVISLLVVIILCVIGVVLFKRYRRPTLANLTDSDKQMTLTTMSTDNPIYDACTTPDDACTTPEENIYSTISECGVYSFPNKGYEPDAYNVYEPDVSKAYNAYEPDVSKA